MLLFVLTLQIILFILASSSIFYYLISLAAAERFFRLPSPKGAEPSSPVSVLIPLCGTDPDAYENYVSFCRQEHPCFQLIFGVHDPNDPATVYVVERPSSGGSSAFRMKTEGGIEGAFWVPIADSVQQTRACVQTAARVLSLQSAYTP